MGDPDRSHSRRRVVVIDDDRDVRDVMTEVLELAGYEVSVPSDAHVAIDDLAATQPDLIVLDLFLSDDTDQGGGWDYLRRLRRTRASDRCQWSSCRRMSPVCAGTPPMS